MEIGHNKLELNAFEIEGIGGYTKVGKHTWGC